MLIQVQRCQLDAFKGELTNGTEAAAAKCTRDASSAVKKHGFLGSIKIGGVIGVEATNTETYAGADSSDITLAKLNYFSTHSPMNSQLPCPAAL